MQAPPSLRHTVTCDAAVDQRIQYRQIAFAGHAEDMGDALYLQLIDKNLGGGAGHGIDLGMQRHPNTTFSV